MKGMRGTANSLDWDHSVDTNAPQGKEMLLLCLHEKTGVSLYQVSRDSAVVRTLAFYQCGPGFIPGPSAIMWVEFEVGSCSC